MRLSGDGKLLRIFIGESDKIHHKALFDAIIHSAKEKGLAGCTILRGIEGFGADSHIIHTAKILRLSEDLPIVIEIVDTEEKIKSFLPEVEQMIETAGCGAMITLEKVEIIRYSHGL
jgi:PII-like signaling protein